MSESGPLGFVCSAFGAVTGIMMGYPLDTLKVRLQILGSKASIPKGSAKSYYPSLYSSTLNCFGRTAKYEGLRGFYRGAGVTLLGQAPIIGIAFFGIDSGKLAVKYLFKPAPPNAGFVFHHWAVATGISGFITAIFMTPTERIKCILQIQAAGTSHLHYNGMWDCAKKTWRSGGIRNMYKGFSATYLRGFGMAGCYLGTNEQIKALMTPSNGRMSPVRTTITAGLTGMLVWAVVLPIDVVKTVIHTAPEKANTSATKIVKVATRLMTTEGVRAFYRGFVPVVVRAMITNIGMFSGYGLMHSLLTAELNVL